MNDEEELAFFSDNSEYEEEESIKNEATDYPEEENNNELDDSGENKKISRRIL